MTKKNRDRKFEKFIKKINKKAFKMCCKTKDSCKKEHCMDCKRFSIDAMCPICHRDLSYDCKRGLPRDILDITYYCYDCNKYFNKKLKEDKILNGK